MIPNSLPDENLSDPTHPFHEVWRKWNTSHTAAEPEESGGDSDKKEENNKENKENNSIIREDR